MPASVYMGELLKLEVEAGRVNESAVDDSVRRIVTQMFKFGLFDIPNPNERSANVTSQVRVYVHTHENHYWRRRLPTRPDPTDRVCFVSRWPTSHCCDGRWQ
jgi:hypothetical protein